MKRKLTENIPLKIMSVAVAILVWLLVVNINNPIVTNYYTIPSVELVNEAYIDSTGQMCLLDENQGTVRVAITGERKLLSRITVDDIHAVADLQQAVSLDTDPVMVPITATCTGILPGNIKTNPQNLSIHLEEKDTMEFAVSVTSGDSKPGKGYEVGAMTANPEKVRITGPKSLINKIDKVNATLNLEGKTEDVSEDVTLTIIDKNQDSISDTEMNYLKIENDGKVTVNAKLWKVRTGVEIMASYTGQPADGYQVGDVTTVPNTISIAGSEEALKALELQGNVIEIPAGDIDISNESRDVEKKISLTELLPEDVELTSDASEDVWVTVNILPVGSAAYTMPTSQIQVKNQPENLQVTFETAQIEIRVKAKDKTMDDFDEASIKASIDLEDKAEGNYEVPVKIVLPAGYELVDAVTTEVKISAFSTTEESEE